MRPTWAMRGTRSNTSSSWSSKTSLCRKRPWPPTWCCRQRPSPKRTAHSRTASDVSNASVLPCGRLATRDPTGRSRPTSPAASVRLGLSAEQFDYASPRDVFDEMAGLTPIMAGINYDRLDREGGIQWPCPTPTHPGTPNLYTETFPRANGLARLTPVRQGPAAVELPDDDYPIELNTGRVLYHWHGGTITSRVDGLLELVPEVEATIHPDDADTYGVRHASLVRV